MTSRIYWKKSFPFSSSFERDGQIHGYNFTLVLTAAIRDDFDEKHITQTVQRELIQKIHSKDLSVHVDFLKGNKISDVFLLKKFSSILLNKLKPLKMVSLALRRDDRTRTELVF